MQFTSSVQGSIHHNLILFRIKRKDKKYQVSFLFLFLQQIDNKFSLENYLLLSSSYIFQGLTY